MGNVEHFVEHHAFEGEYGNIGVIVHSTDRDQMARPLRRGDKTMG